jgi:hypothetical protein
MYLWMLIQLIIVFGLCLIAISEANVNDHPGWALYFVINALACIVMYVRVFAWWLDWIRRTTDWRGQTPP